VKKISPKNQEQGRPKIVKVTKLGQNTVKKKIDRREHRKIYKIVFGDRRGACGTFEKWWTVGFKMFTRSSRCWEMKEANLAT